MEEIRRTEGEEEAGQKGGAAEVYGPRIHREEEVAVVGFGPARWSGIWAGFVTAVASEVLWAVMGYAVWGTGVGAHTGFYTFAGVMYLVSLALGGYIMSQMGRILDTTSALANGAVLWGLNFTLLLALVTMSASFAVTGVAVGAPAGAAAPGPLAGVSFTVAWAFVLFEFLALLFTLGGAMAGINRGRREEAR